MDFLLEIADEGGMRHIISLTGSSNLDVARAALLFVCDTFSAEGEILGSGRRHLVKHGVVQALLHNLACDSSDLFHESARVMNRFWEVMDPPLLASTMQHLIHLLPSLEDLAKTVVISSMNYLMDMDDDIDDMELLDPSVPRLLIQLARDGMCSLYLLEQLLRLISFVLLKCRELRDAFRAEGLESFLADAQHLSHWNDSVRKGINDSLDLLRES